MVWYSTMGWSPSTENKSSAYRSIEQLHLKLDHFQTTLRHVLVGHWVQLASHPALPMLPCSFIADDILKYRVLASCCRQWQLTVMLLQKLLKLQHTYTHRIELVQHSTEQNGTDPFFMLSQPVLHRSHYVFALSVAASAPFSVPCQIYF